MAKRKVLLLGGSGFLGGEILRLVPKNIDLWATYYKNKLPKTGRFKGIKINLTNFNLLKNKLNMIKPEIVVQAAKIHPFNEDPAETRIFTAQLVKAIKQIGAKLIYISSDAVFAGKKGNYKENDKPRPQTDYGKAKLAAEKAIKDNLNNFIIIRPSYIYGKSGGKWDKRTIELLNQLKQKKAIYRFKDMYRSPILVRDLAKAIWRLTGKDFTGIIHIAGKRKNVFNFNREILKEIGLDPRLIKPNSIKKSKAGITVDTSLDIGLAKKILN